MFLVVTDCHKFAAVGAAVVAAAVASSRSNIRIADVVIVVG